MSSWGTVANLLFGLSIVSVMGVSNAAHAAQGEGAQPEGAGDPAGDPTIAPAGDPLDSGATDSTDYGATDDPYAEPTDTPPSDDDTGYSASASTSNGTIVAADANVSSGSGIDPFKGRFAIGAIRTIAGLNGINFRYFVADKLSVGASTGIALFAYKENEPGSTDICPGDDCVFENTRTVAALAFNAEVLYWAKLGRPAGQLPFRADFGLGGRFGIMSIINANDAPDNLDDPFEMHIEIPLVIQLMFGNNFSIAPEVGMDFRIVPGSREAGDTNPGTGFPSTISGDAVNGPGFGWEITPGVGLFAGASIHYIFGRN